MLHVLTLSTLFPDALRPGFGVFVGHQTRHLANHPDVDLTVVAPIGLPPAPLDRMAHYGALRMLPGAEPWEGITIHRPRFAVIPKIGTRFAPRLMARGILPLIRRLHREKPFDVIDAEFFWPDGPAAAIIGRALGIPFSIKARGSDIHFWGEYPPARRQMVAAAARANGLLAVSGAMRDSMVNMGMPGDRITVHHTGVDLARFAPIDRAEAKAKLGITGHHILSVGTLNANKGQHLVLDALRQLPGTRYDLIGHGPEAIRLQRMAVDFGVSDRVRFLGTLPQAELPLHYAAADAMVLPSGNEGLANAWIESLASGTPIVITDAGGAREVVTSDDAGRIVDRAPAAIAAGIRSLIDQPVAPEAARAIASRFSWNTNRDTLYAHLRGLVKSAA